ncbi:sirohydrochlorin chelatase [Thauera linaloolentis]|uniref:Cobalamin (Vitamin B12) biosynthesis CbiX protein n=1 Tax=Thauera linaloolentis (strain DSM 12138 / JCM 21573 / CCUG 41526 / CIP 105981 / IAM 15112 / NBRC 102519 / 47Lol) TaxID=1123367 RepID=N6YGI0_THAL4|nr:CbiX/SirB N-terminal domain-containing protein [Thauera linaloolentis]ENO90625.1 cobalamin (vitamin B12) biosynthesis CbiX protein [Thauera linaloolentis 47Lol = DSM 12138]MCM8566131.1 CbiX/SirB N-terminal domain-containing protein [Thauera linaloolentis]
MSDAASQDSAAVVLFGHGARDPEWAGPMRRIRACMLAQPGAPRVELAFLEFMQPRLPEAIAALAATGVRRIAVVPIFLAQNGHLKRDLPALLDEARAAHPACEISLAVAAGEADTVIAAMAGYARACVG